MTKEDFIRLTIEEARKATYPFGAVLVIDGEVVATSGSGGGPENIYDTTAHAETNVIRKACAKLESAGFFGKDAVLYSSCEPCMMCMGAAWYSGIRTLVYGSSIESMQKYFPWEDLAAERTLAEQKFSTEGGILEDEVEKMYEGHPATNK